MAKNKNFFQSPQAAAIYKHKLLKSYIPAWAGKTGSTASGKRVVVYDAYSGPGRYEDDQPGSPELLVDTAVSMADLRSVLTVFSEKDKGYCDRLNCMLLEKGVDPATYEVRSGAVEHNIDEVLALAGNLPLFVFLDPYGLTIPFERVVNTLTSRDKAGYSPLLQPKTELLMNFSYEAVRRISGVVRSDKDFAAKEGQIRSLNAALGGDWWQDLARNEADGWVKEILRGYARRISKAASFGGSVTAEVADSIEAEPVYELILFTRHRDGLWEMLRSMSMARKAWREWLVTKKADAAGGQLELSGLDFEDNEDAWVDEISVNITKILTEVSGFVIERRLGDVLGRTVGLARETHIRRALKKLQESKIIAAVPTGSLQKAYIARS